MANRYDRGSDDYGRREASRENERENERRQGRAEAQGHPYEERQGRPNTWREGQHEREQAESDWRGQEYRSAGRDERWRERGAGSENDYYSAREGGNVGRGYYSSGRDYSGEREQYPERQAERYSGDQARRDERNYRGYYQEQVWTRDPRSGNLYGYEYSTRVDPRRFNAGDESTDRWRSGANEQNRRFDIDRGWRGTGGYHTGDQGTSGYGNTTRGHSQFGKGPKGYVRSDERIREDVCDRLSDDDEVDAGDITVTVKNAEVILEGTVIDRRTKHRAEDIAESVSGAKEVTNHLRARKGFLQEIGDKLSGQDDQEHHGHSGSGTRNATGGAAPRTAH
jgi:osmotically-inducible protein OsmY